MDNKASMLQSECRTIPEGYVEVKGPDGRRYLVPHFYAPALQIKLDGNREKRKLNIGKAAGTGSSDRERLAAHAEVLGLQERLGISYKDASHRLYMADMERLKADEQMFKAFATLEATTRNAIEKAINAVKEIEEASSNDMDLS